MYDSLSVLSCAFDVGVYILYDDKRCMCFHYRKTKPYIYIYIASFYYKDLLLFPQMSLCLRRIIKGLVFFSWKME